MLKYLNIYNSPSTGVSTSLRTSWWWPDWHHQIRLQFVCEKRIWHWLKPYAELLNLNYPNPWKEGGSDVAEIQTSVSTLERQNLIFGPRNKSVATCRRRAV